MNIQLLNSATDGHKTWGQQTINNNTYSHNPECSCNMGINNFAATIQPQNQNVSRASIAMLPINEQRRIFSALNNEDKWKLFKEKINIILKTEPLNGKEKDHLEAILNFFQPEYYNHKQDYFVKPFLTNWNAYAKNILGWDESKLYLYVGTIVAPNEITINNYNVTGSSAVSTGGSAASTSCHCSSESPYCQNRSCVFIGCQSSGGCGFAWWYPCDGICGNATI